MGHCLTDRAPEAPLQLAMAAAMFVADLLSPELAWRDSITAMGGDGRLLHRYKWGCSMP